MPAQPLQPYLVFYDGTCVLCQRSKRWLESRDRARRLRFIDSRDPAAMAAYPSVTPAETEGQILVLTPVGTRALAYDGIITLLQALPGWQYLYPFATLPPMRWLGKHAYRFIARNRYRLFGRVNPCESGACKI
jgi:predicted DCC family thiol-disulfide oxidoreductase YuxK